eukprot:CCRYP_007477-RC/>CCRYP_007477-RC protein AED:0.34 eAED:0.37 QI:382/0.5/0.33/1/0.5/0.33/3/0/385
MLLTDILITGKIPPPCKASSITHPIHKLFQPQKQISIHRHSQKTTLTRISHHHQTPRRILTSLRRHTHPHPPQTPQSLLRRSRRHTRLLHHQPTRSHKTQLQSSSAAVGELSSASGHPLAIAKTIFQKEGIAGFFRGLPPTLVGIIPSRSVYFYSYEQSKRFLGPILPEGSVSNALLSGLAAGMAGNTLTNPLWVVKTRMQLLADRGAGQKVYAGYGDAVRTIWREEGLGGFYKGISASYWGCTEGAVQFMLYEQIKSRFFERMNRRRQEEGKEVTDKLPQMVYFFSAAIAKGTASVITYPHEVARTRLREQARNGVFKYKGMWQTIRVIAKEEGRKGLYGGMGVHLMKVVPNSAIMFLTYEIVNALNANIKPNRSQPENAKPVH